MCNQHQIVCTVRNTSCLGEGTTDNWIGTSRFHGPQLARGPGGMPHLLLLSNVVGESSPYQKSFGKVLVRVNAEGERTMVLVPGVDIGPVGSVDRWKNGVYGSMIGLLCEMVVVGRVGLQLYAVVVVDT